MLNAGQVRLYVVGPALKQLDLWSQAAEDLVLGTGLVESRLSYLHQVNGPALGLFQMEPATHDDIWSNYIKTDLRLKLYNMMMLSSGNQSNQMVWNLLYAAAMCRIHYRRVPEPLPDVGNIYGYAYYWKKYYNTPAGKGEPQKFVEVYNSNATVA